MVLLWQGLISESASSDGIEYRLRKKYFHYNNENQIFNDQSENW